MSNDIEQRVKAIISEQLGVELSAVTEDKHFVADLGADSLDTVELVMSLEDAFNLEVSDVDAEHLVTVKAAIDYVKSKHQ